ncbi:MAG: hypothetical protein EBV06_15070 [Planctomycetia bacterium]|nr:hypothetical protein [Planctomycetia bacterium]
MLPILLFTLTADIDRLPPSSIAAARLIRPQDGELKWTRIPWQMNLATAVDMAATEKRPLMVWVAGDPPLERC